jgi:hypothetical protein
VHDISDGLPGTLLEEYAYDDNGNRQKALSNYPGAVPLDTEFPSGIRCPGPSGELWHRTDRAASAWEALGPRFLRIDAFNKAEPRDSGACRCGCPDRWRCWSRTRRAQLFGQARSRD